MLQTTVAPFIKISEVHPDLVLIFVVGWVFLRGTEEGLYWALIGGVSLDFFANSPFGVFTLALLLVTLLSSLAQGLRFGSSIVLPLSLIFPLSVLFNSLALLFLLISDFFSSIDRTISWANAFSNIFVPTAIFNTVVMMLGSLLDKIRTKDAADRSERNTFFCSLQA
ncbi:MAG: rod shape-determining protein MreD, partial [Chloroflexota bacterium]